MTKEEAIETIRKEARDYPNRSAAFMADFAEVVISRIGKDDNTPHARIDISRERCRIDLKIFGRLYCHEISDPDRSDIFIGGLAASIMQPRPDWPRPDFLIIDDPQQEERMK
ncbi:MAG: hypothetical protein IKO72_12435 [Kiritimatiellae bacterium]|nr:hypothetical protein [Kiritimatiellia bacterium]